MNKHKKGLPLKSFSWSKNKKKTKSQLLVESTIIEWYKAKHRDASKEEIDYLNNLPLKNCPYCGCQNVVKNGLTSYGVQRFKCNYCSKRFNVLTNTIFDSKKIPISEWIEYLLHLFEFHSIRSTSFDNRNASSTGRYWLEKVFLVLNDYQNNIKLSGKVWIDEKYVVERKGKLVLKPNGKKETGLSKNQYCILSGVDENGKCFMEVIGKNKINRDYSLWVYGNRIEKGSHIIHDAENSYLYLAKRTESTEETHTSSESKAVKDKDDPLGPINKIHDLFTKFIESYYGFDRGNLQDWCNLFCFIVNKPKDRYDKALYFIELSINKQVKIRYRDFYKRKDN